MTQGQPDATLAVMLFRILAFLVIVASPAAASECETSPRPVWPVACADAQVRVLMLELATTERAVQDNPMLTPAARIAAAIIGEATLRRLDACVSTASPLPCIRLNAMRRIGEMWNMGLLPDGYRGQSRMTLAFCPTHAPPVRLVRVETDPVLLWTSYPYGALLERDPASRNVVYGGEWSEGTLDLGITPAGRLVLTGTEPRPIECFIDDLNWLR